MADLLKRNLGRGRVSLDFDSVARIAFDFWAYGLFNLFYCIILYFLKCISTDLLMIILNQFGQQRQIPTFRAKKLLLGAGLHNGMIRSRALYELSIGVQTFILPYG